MKASWSGLARHILLEPITESEPWQEWVLRRYPDFHENEHIPALVRAARGNPRVITDLFAGLAKP